ncbi:MAG: GNAT family N-acetyltransferase [Ignavibacteriaceae bacterium]
MKKIIEDEFEKKLNDFENFLNNGELYNSGELLIYVEGLLKNHPNSISKSIWYKYLNLTRFPFFLKNLKSKEEQYRWADTSFKIIKISGYSLLEMINQRTDEHPEKPLFSVLEGNVRNDYSYSLVFDKISRIATSFIKYAKQKPVVALYLDNCIEGALCDIASLSYDIFISPLNIHFGLDNLCYIFDLLKFNIVVTDTPSRVELLKNVRQKINLNFTILYVENTPSQEDKDDGVYKFENFLSSVNDKEIHNILKERKHFDLHDISTVMFTSGSTGTPKGVAFTNFNLITKRFARGAVFPEVGNNEILLSYLPLFHTFGRYFEMMGMIYWGGNYVFAGKSDIDSLIQLLQKIKPTGLVSIPLRWKQIYDSVIERKEISNDKVNKQIILKDLTGGNLKWGISAAGYLESKVFRFFNSNSIDLCSGFGMTEGTGGISMTPPGEYVKNSVGIPLPGIKVRFSDEGELQVAGPYIAKYYDDLNKTQSGEYWMKTGDLFTRDQNGYLFIIDRIKDIYKNSKGQTIAPAFIEKKFENIPGLKKAFLVGDRKPYNTLLIVPDFNEPFVQRAETQHKLKSYFGTLISEVNRNLSPFERIVKFIILERNFDEQKGELTSKGTFKRKIIENNFKSIIDELYKKANIEFSCFELKILIPIWALKDIGITENDIICSPNYIKNKENGARLTIKKINFNKIRIGNFDYVVRRNEIDLGIFILQPILWLGNIELIEFFFCKEEWEADFQGISSQIFVHPHKNLSINSPWYNEKINPKLKDINNLIVNSLYGNEQEILSSLDKIENLLQTGEHRIKNLINRRLEALSTHPDFNVRSRAYKILLFTKPDIDYNRYLPAFINSGLPFLNKKVIENIFRDNIEGFNLNAFRKRLVAYRKGLTWPANQNTREQFKRIFDLLVYFVHKNPSSYSAVREELIIWILYTDEPVLSQYAQELFKRLAKWFEARFSLSQYEESVKNWKEKVTFQDTIPKDEQKRIEKIFYRSTFLKEAFMLIFSQNYFDLKDVSRDGIFISTISAASGRYLYRVSVNTKNYKHYDFVILIKPDITRKEVLETIYLMIKISSTFEGISVLPKFGNFRSKLGVVSFEFVNDLSVWERIRMLNSSHSFIGKKNYEFELKLLFTRGMASYFRVLKNSDYRVMPGNFSPSNAVVPESHFKKGSLIFSIAGWYPYNSFAEFLRRLYNNFYLQTYAHYPSSRDNIKISWLFDGCLEALGRDEGLLKLKDILAIFSGKKSDEIKKYFSDELERYLKEIVDYPYIDSYILSAIKNYTDWIEENPSPPKDAKEVFVNNLYSLYRIDKYPEIYKYIFYSKTYYSDSSREIWFLFTKLINSLFKYPEEPASSRIELAELQEELKDEIDKRVLNNIIYPSINQNFELMTEEESEEKEIFLKTKIIDAFGFNYTIRKPISAFEIANLHKIFILDNYPIKIDPNLKYLIITDDEDEETIAGGLCYKIQYMNIAQLEGIDIAKPYRKKDLSRKLLEDFYKRLRSDGIKTLITYFYLNSFFEKFGFKIDSRWGGLVKKIE